MNNAPSFPARVHLWVGWLAFFATFPGGMIAGWSFAQGQDAAGKGIGVALGMFGVGLGGGLAAAGFISYCTVRSGPQFAGRLLAPLPWIVLTAFWGMTLLTPAGDRLVEWLERL